MTSKEKEIGKILREIYFSLAYHFNIEPNFEFFFEKIKNENVVPGLVLGDKKIIFINSAETVEIHSTLTVLYHEFRHCWQHETYANLMQSWTEDTDFYNRYKDDDICTPELDAEWFGKSRGECNTTPLLDYGMDFYRRLRAKPDRVDELREGVYILLHQAIRERDPKRRISFPLLESKLLQILPVDPFWKDFYRA